MTSGGDFASAKEFAEESLCVPHCFSVLFCPRKIFAAKKDPVLVPLSFCVVLSLCHPTNILNPLPPYSYADLYI